MRHKSLVVEDDHGLRDVLRHKTLVAEDDHGLRDVLLRGLRDEDFDYQLQQRVEPSRAPAIATQLPGCVTPAAPTHLDRTEQPHDPYTREGPSPTPPRRVTTSRVRRARWAA